MARATHEYTDKVVDVIWKEGIENMYKNNELVLVAVPLSSKRYGINIVERKFLRSKKGEFVVADNKTFKVILKKLSIYNKTQSIQFFYQIINTLLQQHLNKIQKNNGNLNNKEITSQHRMA